MNPKPKSERFVTTLGTWLVDRINIFFRVRHFIKMVAQRWILLALAIVVSLAISIYLAAKSPNIYQAISKISIAPKIQVQNQIGRSQFVEELNSFYEIQMSYMVSSKILERVQDKMKEHAPPSPVGFVAIPNVKKGPGSFSMVMESTDLDYAKKFVTIWAREFVNFKDEIKDTALGNKVGYVRQEINSNERNLAKARAVLLEFEKTNDIASIKDVLTFNQTSYDRLTEQVEQIVNERKKLEKKTPEEVAMEGKMEIGGNFKNERPSANENSPAGGTRDNRDLRDPSGRYEAGSRYSELKFELKTKLGESNRVSATLRPKHPYMVRLQKEIAQVEQNIRTQLELTEERRLARIQELKVDEEATLPQIEEYKIKLRDSAQTKFLHDKLREEVDTYQTLLTKLRLEQNSLEAVGSDDATLAIMEEGTGSTKPIRPNRPQMVAFGLLIGSAIGLAIIFLLSKLDDRLELAEDIEAELEQPVLGQIPQVDMSKLALDHVLITRMDEHNMFSEAIRGVRSAVMLGNNGGKKQVLLVSSAVPGDGKTTFTVNFAVTLAIAGYKVLLIDADLRRGNVHGYFGEPRDPGFAEMLLGELHWTDVLKTTEVKTLDTIYTGKLPNNPGELLISPVTRQFIEEARQSYDYVVFDCPPLTAIDDTFSLAGLADGLLFVVRSGQTSMRFAKNAINAVKQRGANLLGLVLNGITADNPNYYYQNYYHNYYSTEQKGGLKNAPLPALKMAAPKSSTASINSIEAQAKALRGEEVSPETLAAAERLKAERFRARTAAAKEKFNTNSEA